MAAVAVLAGRLVVRPRGVGHVAVLRMAAGCGVAAADAVDVGIQADIAAAGLPDLGMAPVQHGGRVAVVTGVAVLPPVVPGRAAVQEIRDLAAAELVLRLAAVAVVSVRAVIAVGDRAAVLMGDGAPADDVTHRATGLGLHHVSVEIAVGDGARVLIGDAACPAAVVHLDAAAAQFARVHIAGLDGAVVGIDQTAQAALGRYSASVPAVGDGAVVDERQGSAGIERIILALALRHGDIRQLRARADIAEQGLSPAIQPHTDRVAVAVEGAGIRVLAGADGRPDLIHILHVLPQLRAGTRLTGVHRVPQPDELRRAGDLIGVLRRAAAAGLRAGDGGQQRGLIGVRLSRQRQHRGSRRVVSGQVQPGRLLLRQGLLRLVDGVQLAGYLVRVGVRDVLRRRQRVDQRLYSRNRLVRLLVRLLVRRFVRCFVGRFIALARTILTGCLRLPVVSLRQDRLLLTGLPLRLRRQRRCGQQRQAQSQSHQQGYSFFDHVHNLRSVFSRLPYVTAGRCLFRGSPPAAGLTPEAF